MRYLSVLAGLLVMTGTAYADDDFLAACEAEAAEMGENDSEVCGCMVDEAGGDQDIIDELMASMSETDMGARRAMLSDDALAVVEACAPA